MTCVLDSALRLDSHKARVPGSSVTQSDDHRWTPTRSAGLARLNDFVTQGVEAYAKTRNYVHARGHHHNVSRLSPYLRHRLITEQEVIAAVVNAAGETQSRAFVDEVLWRCYWKAYLQKRPSLIRHYHRELQSMKAEFHQHYDNAIGARTGIACFDAWTQELVDTGYLHNHARMWWASVWCFTLELPWQLGADFFMQHLLDADPASNTLSWRWVAGLHSPGKVYRASADNIATFTCGRYPRVQALAPNPIAPEHGHPEPDEDPLAPWIAEKQEGTDGPTGLLVAPHDLHPESQWEDPVGPIAIWSPERALSQEPSRLFQHGALKDCAQRLEVWSQSPVTWLETPGDLSQWVQTHRLQRVVMSTPPMAQGLNRIPLIANTIHPVELRLHTRAWDKVAWQHAERGFFRFRKKNAASLLALVHPSRPAPTVASRQRDQDD